MSQSLTRRSFVHTSISAGAASIFVSSRGLGTPALSGKVLDTKIISPQPEYYNGWPTVVCRQNGELWVTWSGGREAHICPFGQVMSMVSRDNGESWTWPRVLLNSAIDDRDSGVLETPRGTLLVTTFSSLAYEGPLSAALKSGKWPVDRLAHWQAAQARLSPEDREKQLGEWMLRSTDGGISWSTPYPTIVNSPHGPVALKDGRLLYVGKQLWTSEQRIGICESKDDGQSWQWLAEIPARPGETSRGYHELHAVEATDGTLIAQIRNHHTANAGETLQSESQDGGRTWTLPHSIGVWGLPSHLLKLRDGRLLMTYGYRRAPFGNLARVSDNHGKTWSTPMTISSDGASGDLGYPSTVELGDGTLLTIWYESMKTAPKAVLRQARWRKEA